MTNMMTCDAIELLWYTIPEVALVKRSRCISTLYKRHATLEPSALEIFLCSVFPDRSCLERRGMIKKCTILSAIPA